MNKVLAHIVGALGLVASLLLGIVAWEILQRSGVFDPVPFKDVEVLEKTVDGDIVTVHFRYIKTACTIRRLRVVGETLGVIGDVPWKTSDGRTAAIEREPGLQTGTLIIDTQGNDVVEVRTRHDCDGMDIHRVFLRLVLKGDDAVVGQTRGLKAK